MLLPHHLDALLHVRESVGSWRGERAFLNNHRVPDVKQAETKVSIVVSAVCERGEDKLHTLSKQETLSPNIQLPQWAAGNGIL